MKTLHLIPYMHPSTGGPPVVVDRWCIELRKLGVDSEVLTTNAYSSGDSDQQWIEDYRCEYPISVAHKTGPNGFGFSPELKRVLIDSLQSADLVHVHNLWGYTNLLAARYCTQQNIPFVVSSHGMLDPNSVGRKLIKKKIYGRLLEWPALRRAAGLICTHAEEARLAAQTCADLPPQFIVPLGTQDPPNIDREILTEIFFEAFPVCKGRRLVTFLSRLHPKKGLDLLIPAMIKVVERIPDAMLVLAGPGSESYVSELQRLVRHSGLGDRVIFTGMLSGIDKWAALAAADVFALPSYQENFAIALVEALRIGTPAVISNRINIWSDLVDNDAAVLTELYGPAIADAICSVLSNAETADKLAANGIRLAETNYTWQRSAEMLLDTYRTILGIDFPATKPTQKSLPTTPISPLSSPSPSP